MRRTLSLVALPLFAGALALGLASCTSAATSNSGNVEVSAGTVVLDVRTPDEYAAGHLDGAQLLDFNGGEVATALPKLDPEAEYLVYCRSGNRSAQAIALMEQAGFSNLTNLGSLDQAATATGLQIVR